MKSMTIKLVRSSLGLVFFVQATFFFYIDVIIFRYVIWPSWEKGSFQISEKLNIFNYSFNDNMAYLPVAVYLTFGLIFLFLTIRIFYQTWIKKN